MEPSISRTRLACAAVLVAVSLLLAACASDLPDLSGQSLNNAQGKLVVSGYKIGHVTYDPNSSAPAGTVVKQNPPPGSVFLGKHEVDLTVAGDAPVIVPDLRGKDVGAAARLALAKGLTLGEEEANWNSKAPSGTVTFQDPAAGGLVPAGAGIDVIVSKGAKPPPVPRVIGMDAAQAKKVLAAHGLRSELSYRDSGEPRGSVIDQQPAGGALARPGTLVQIVASTGGAPVLVPKVAGLTQTAAISALKAVGLKAFVATTPAAAGATSQVGRVYSQTPGPFVGTTRGKTVTIYVYSAPAQ